MKFIFFATSLVLIGLMTWVGVYSAYASVDISQSSSSSSSSVTVNGHTTTSATQTDNGKTIVETPHGFLSVNGSSVMYCQDLKHNGDKQTCGPTYKLHSDGTIN